MKLYILCGLQGSGKSTYAKKHQEIFQAEIISTDQIRKDYQPIAESEVFPTAFSLIKDCFQKGKNVIFDATNINKEARKRNLSGIFSLINKAEIETICVCLKVDKDVCKSRVEKRNTLDNEIYLPLEVIDRFNEDYEDPTLSEGFDEIIFVK